MSSARAPVQYSENVREMLRRRGEPIAQDVSLQRRDGCVRTTLMAAAFDEYDEHPEEVRQYYDPRAHAIVIPLPRPDTTTLEDF